MSIVESFLFIEVKGQLLHANIQFPFGHQFVHLMVLGTNAFRDVYIPLHGTQYERPGYKVRLKTT